jgi:hypothetical protein
MGEKNENTNYYGKTRQNNAKTPQNYAKTPQKRRFSALKP